jgi:protein SCO1/2
MRAVRQRLPESPQSGIPIEFVTISLDAPPDETAVLQAYSREIGAASDGRWRVVTGTPERVKWVVGGGFGLYYDWRDDGTIKLDPGTMLVDGAGILRAEYRTAAPDVETILRDITLLLEEAENNEGALRYAYEAAHLFSCYPR